jgi:EAL domain-containing protein (putative c-di-GMP-specific phosphodiesterase class I)
LRVVAEGVESRQHHEELTALGCDEAQGFHYSHAIGDTQFLSWAADYDEAAANAVPDPLRVGYLVSRR